MKRHLNRSCLETALNRPTSTIFDALALRAAALCLALVGLASLAGCNKGQPEPAPAAAAAAASGPAAAATDAAASAAPPVAAASMLPVSVTLVRAAVRDFTLTLDATGTVAALSSVEVKPQVSAQVLAVHVKEGQFVQRGQALFTLDARVDQANLKKAEAQLQKDEVSLADARRQLARSQDLLAKNFISQGTVDTGLANVEGQQAVVAADKAAIDAVKAQLSFSRIAAQGAGRVGVITVFPGSSVSPSGAAMLTITQLDPVAVSFGLPQRNLPDALKALASGNGRVTALLPYSVALAVAGSGAGGGTGGGAAGGAKFGPGRAASAPAPGASSTRPMAASALPAASGPGRPASAPAGAASGAGRGGPGAASAVAGARQGKLVFVDSAVDATSGTVKVKAQFANADQALWPGAYVTVKMALQTLPDAIVVPQAAIVQGARGTAVFAAGPGNVAVIRPVKILASAGTEAVVSGLKPGERVVLDGRQNVRPGTPLIERAAEPGRGASGPRGGDAGAPASAPASAAAAAPAIGGGRAP